MAEKNLPSCSDDSDDDYVPEGVPDVSEEESDGEAESNEEDDSKSKRKTGPTKKKRRKVEKEKNESCEEKPAENETEESIDKGKDYVDNLWQTFKDDAKKKPTKAENETPEEVFEASKAPKKSPSPEVENTQTKQSTASVTNRSNIIKRGNPRGGLSSVLSQLGKKDKLSTLEKSKLDWTNFKRNEGIEDDIQTFNRGKDGYLEKQDFLQRADLRQFEIEKQLRANKRSFR